MNQQIESLLKLIQLHEGLLSNADGVAVREQLATNPELLKQWKKLSSIYNEQASFENEEEIKEVDAELIAQYVDQKMEASQLIEFESSCWDNPAIIREIISAVQASHVDSSSIKIPKEFKPHSQKTSRRMQDFIHQQCSTVDASQNASKYLQEIEEQPQSNLDSTFDKLIEPEIDEEIVLERLPVVHKSQSKKQAKKKRQKRKRQQRLMIAGIAVAVIAIAFPVYFSMNHDRDSTTISIAEKTASKNKAVSQNKSKSPTETSLTENSESDNKENSTEKLPDEMSKQGDKETAVATQENKPKPLPEKHDLQITWANISGIAAYRAADSMRWKGILSEKSNGENSSETGKLTFRTLPSSWLQGQIETGTEIIVDANSEVQIAVYSAVNQEKSKRSEKQASSTQSLIELELHSGRIALSQLNAGDVLKVISGQQEWSVQATLDNTSIGLFQQENKTQELVTFSGETLTTLVAMNKNVALKSNQAIVMTQQGLEKTLRVSPNQRWRTEPAETLQLSKAFIAEVNKSDNLLAALYSAPSSKAPAELLVSTQLAFSLDPVATVPRAASSKIETHRTAAIEWLLASPDNETTGTVWNKIAVTGNGNQSALSVRKWFKAAQGKIPANQKLLTEMSIGLAAKQPLFVRQCAIHFLRQITRQQLAEYNPTNPTQAAIASVRLKIRRATGKKTRRRR